MSTQTEELIDYAVAVDLENTIIVFNDDYNTFDHVIESFVEVLGHSSEQAEQCAWIIHTRGKCKVKQGDYEALVPLCSAILDRGISAEIQ